MNHGDTETQRKMAFCAPKARDVLLLCASVPLWFNLSSFNGYA